MEGIAVTSASEDKTTPATTGANAARENAAHAH
jgi:hypothetical protein